MGVTGLGPLEPDAFETALAAVRAGEPAGLDVLWRAYHPSMVRYLRAAGAADEADDLASATWVEVIRGIDRFQGGPAGFRAWLFTVARHRLLDHRRAASRRPRTTRLPDHLDGDGIDRQDPRSDPLVITQDAEATRAAVAAISRLPPEQAEIVALRVIGGFTVDEVAQLVGRPPGTVRVMAHRALKRLAGQVGPSGSGSVTPDADPTLEGGT